jgi:hypothetical protein
MSGRRTRTADNGRFPIMSDVKCVPRLLKSNRRNFVNIENTIEGWRGESRTNSLVWLRVLVLEIEKHPLIDEDRSIV